MANETMFDMDLLSEANETLDFMQTLNKQSKIDMLVLFTGVRLGVVMTLENQKQDLKPA